VFNSQKLEIRAEYNENPTANCVPCTKDFELTTDTILSVLLADRFLLLTDCDLQSFLTVVFQIWSANTPNNLTEGPNIHIYNYINIAACCVLQPKIAM
jgi:hypothetical protein